MHSYYIVYYGGKKIACFLCGGDMIEFIERSVLGGCRLKGWKVFFPDGKPLHFTFDVKLRCFGD